MQGSRRCTMNRSTLSKTVSRRKLIYCVTYIGKILPFRNLFADETKWQTSREDCYAVPNQVLLAVVVSVAGGHDEILLIRHGEMNLVIADGISLVRRVRQAVLIAQVFINLRVNFVEIFF